MPDPTPSNVLIVSGYDLGHQPQFAVELAGALSGLEVPTTVVDLAIMPLEESGGGTEGPAAIVLCAGMLTSARLCMEFLGSIEATLPPTTLIVSTGLYGGIIADAPFLARFTKVLIETRGELGTIVEFLCGRPTKQEGRVRRYRTDRTSLPELSLYRRTIVDSEEIVSGYAETTSGCRHRCKHCPIPTVFDGRIVIKNLDDVLDDIEGQVSSGARHISLGDPDFLNAPAHAYRFLHLFNERFPGVTFDATIKIEHLLKHSDAIPILAEAGCLYVISAVESLSNTVLEKLDKGHTRDDVARASRLLDAHGIGFHPSLLPFTPWSTPDDLVDLLAFVVEEGLEDTLEPVQLSIRLLVPPGSLLLDPSNDHLWRGFDSVSYSSIWTSDFPEMDLLQRSIATTVETASEMDEPYRQTHAKIRALAEETLGRTVPMLHPRIRRARPVASTEAWFCCAEPTAIQLTRAGRPTSPPMTTETVALSPTRRVR